MHRLFLSWYVEERTGPAPLLGSTPIGAWSPPSRPQQQDTAPAATIGAWVPPPGAWKPPSPAMSSSPGIPAWTPPGLQNAALASAKLGTPAEEGGTGPPAPEPQPQPQEGAPAKGGQGGAAGSSEGSATASGAAGAAREPSTAKDGHGAEPSGDAKPSPSDTGTNTGTGSTLTESEHRQLLAEGCFADDIVEALEAEPQLVATFRSTKQSVAQLAEAIRRVMYTSSGGDAGATCASDAASSEDHLRKQSA
jgi:hypothetical protein